MSQRERSSVSQYHVLDAIGQMLEARQPVKDLEICIRKGFGEERHLQNTLGGISLFRVSALAIDALGNCDPSFLLDLYERGGKIEENVLADLATAIIWADRRKTDSLDEFHRLRERHER